MRQFKWLACLVFLLTSQWLYAVELKTTHTRIVINDKGFYTSIQVDGEEILGAGSYPIITAVRDGKIILPTSLKVTGDRLILKMEDQQVIELQVKQQKEAITYEVSKINNTYKAVVFGPFKSAIT